MRESGSVSPSIGGDGSVRMPPVGTSRYSRRQLAERAALSAADMAEVNRCRRDHNRLGFAYQLGFVKLTGRLPKQEPLERIDELVTFTGVQLGLDPGVIEGYQQRRETVAQRWRSSSLSRI